MIVTIEQIRTVARSIAPKFGFRPSLISALALQECGRNAKNEMDASIGRLEQRFYQIYVERKMDLASTIEAQFATSWGAWQVMGLSLCDLGYFQWYLNSIPTENWRSNVLQSALNPLTVTEAINYFAVNLDVMCEYACKHLATKRSMAAGMDSFKGEKDKDRIMLLLYNGGGDTSYDDKVLSKEANEKQFYK